MTGVGEGRMTGDAIPQCDALELQIMMIAGNEPAGGLLEIRYRRPDAGGMNQMWHACDRAQVIAETIQGLGRRSDVYVGGAPRRHRHGGIDAIERVWALWADLDTEEAIDACERFSPAPSVLISSGTGKHAWWSLLGPLSPPHARIALRRLARALGADMASAEPARILRPPGTLNFKTDPPRPVICERLELDSFRARDVVGSLPDPPGPTLRQAAPAGPPRRDGSDALLEIPPADYIPALTGRDVGHDGKVQCPLHAGGQERTASMHVYGNGWACFGGCQPRNGRDHAGGGIIEFGARLYGVEPRGAGYREVRRRLATHLLGTAAA